MVNDCEKAVSLRMFDLVADKLKFFMSKSEKFLKLDFMDMKRRTSFPLLLGTQVKESNSI